MRVLVTGHHGYIGSVAAPMLQEAGHDVTGLDTFFYEGCDLGDDVFAVPTLRMDIRDVTTDVLEGYEGIVHLAALSNDPLGELDEELTREINFRGTVELARKAKEAGVRRFVFASSCSMYGAAATDELVTEEAPLRPLTAYAESKVRAEEALSELADDDFAPIFMRNATAYGASPRVRLDVVLNNLAAWAFTTGKVLIMSDGTPWRPLVHVRDITAAAGAALVAPIELVRNEAFNVGANDENYRVRDLAEIVRETFAGCEIEYAEGAGPDPRSYRVDFRQADRDVAGGSTEVDGPGRRSRAARRLPVGSAHVCRVRPVHASLAPQVPARRGVGRRQPALVAHTRARRDLARRARVQCATVRKTEQATLHEPVRRSLDPVHRERLPVARSRLPPLRGRPLCRRAHRPGENLVISGGDDVAVDAGIDEIVGGSDLVGRDHGQPVCESLVNDETPRFEDRRHNENVRLPVQPGQPLLVCVSQDANAGVSLRLFLDEGAERAVADQPQLPAFETAERGEQNVDPFRFDEAPDEEIARLTRRT